jgi:sulfonate transport system permease protein
VTTRFFSRLLIGAVVPLVLLTIWEISVRSGWWPASVIAPPSAVCRTFVEMVADGRLMMHVLASLKRLVSGFVLGGVVGVLLGAIVGLSRLAERMIGPTLQILAPVPIVAWIPLLIVLFGIGDASKVAVISLGTFFVVYFSTVDGIRGTDQKLVEVGYAFNKDRFEILRFILLPSALPNIFSGLRVALGLSWVLLIVAEIIASSKGLGWLIWDARNFSRPDDMIAGMAAVGILGKFSDSAVALVQRWALRWRKSFAGE